MNSQDASIPRASESFREVADDNQPRKRKKTAPPFSLRLTAKERSTLSRQAGSRPLGAYIRERLLGGQVEPRRVIRKPKADDRQIALVLAELGRSRLSSNLNQLAKSANMGTLPLSQDVERDLREACRAVLDMRDALITALGLKPETPQ